MYQPSSDFTATATGGTAATNQYAAYTYYPTTTNAAGITYPYFPPFPPVQQQPPEPVSELPPQPPDLASVTPQIATKTVQRLITHELREAGFESAQTGAVERIELELVAFMEQLFERAHEYANLANRAGAIATDLVLACEDFNMPPSSMRKVVKGKRKKSTKADAASRAPELVPPPSRSPSPDLLPSDDEGPIKTVPATLRMLPTYFPSLPPKHTYLQTPPSPPKKAALPSLEKKLKTAGLVQESLKNLMLATEDTTNQEDGELLGHIVNWEMGAHPRKRWKISR